MKRLFSISLVVVLCFSLFAGCTNKTPTSQPTSDSSSDSSSDSATSEEKEVKEEKEIKDEKKEVKVSLVTDVSGINDQSFNQSSWEGMKCSEKDYGIKISYKESTQNADYIPNLNAMYDEKNDLIWGVGYMMSDAILEAANTNPDQKFAIVDAGNWENTPSNLLGVTFKTEDAGFLVGYIAGKMTKTNKVGFLGGMSIPPLWQFECGYRAGVAYANPEVEVVIQYAESFTDVAKGKSVADGMFVQDVDIIFACAGGLGDGVIEAAKESDKWVIGVDRDQNYMAPDNVLTSAMKRVDNAIYVVNKDLVDGKFEGGKTVVYGIKENAVGIAPTSSKNVPKDILDAEAEIETKLVNGEISAPGNYKELDTFLSSIKK